MRLWRIIAVATAAEAAAASALAGVFGVAGAWNRWLDLINQFSPIWLVLGAMGGAGALALLPPGRQRWGILTLAALGVVVGLFHIGPETLASMTVGFRSEHRPPDLKVVTVNVWSNNADPARTVDVILAADPDVVAVQEEPGPFAAARARLLQVLPFRVACPAGSDLALYSRPSPWSRAVR